MAFRVTTLMENTTPRDCLAAEHGLSLLVEGKGKKVLYDTGASPRFLKNAKSMGADLTGLDGLVLSHGHYDHTGGVSALLFGPNRPACIYLGGRFFGERYSKKQDGLLEIGPAVAREALEASGIPCVEVGSQPIALGEGIWAVSGFTTRDEMERLSPAMLRSGPDGLETDPFEDEVVLVLEGEEGLTLISGCAHVGILSMCARVEELFGRPVTTFLGGTHLMAANDARIQHTCACLKQRGMLRLGACHCSGEKASAYFDENFPGFFRNNVGTVVEV